MFNYSHILIAILVRTLRLATVVALALLLVLPEAVAIDNESNAKLLAYRAKSLVHKTDRTQNRQERKNQRQHRMGSPHAALDNEAQCGGLAIGNVRPALGDHRQHNTTVIINGDVINTNNGC